MSRYNSDGYMEALWVAPFFISNVSVMHDAGGMTYTYRPGARAMRTIMDSLARRFAKQYPWATKLVITRTRTTVGYGVLDGGYKRKNDCENAPFDLTRYR